MTDECKTVTSEAELVDPLYMQQQKDVASMRASLLSLNSGNPTSAKMAIQKITAMRFYHQLSRIIRYTDMMDRIEEKLYESIDKSLDTMDTSRPATWISLLQLQEKLQKSMIESHKLLEPYLDMESLLFVEPPEEVADVSFGAMILEQESRDKLRTSAQAVLAAIQTCEDVEVSEVSDTSKGGEK